MERWLIEARAFAEALFASSAGAPPKDRMDWLVAELADFVEQAGDRTAFILKSGFHAASWLAPPTIGKLPPLERLSIEDRGRALDRLEHTPLGLPLLAAKAALCILYYEHPDVLRETGITRADEDAPGCLVQLRKERVS